MKQTLKRFMNDIRMLSENKQITFKDYRQINKLIKQNVFW